MSICIYIECEFAMSSCTPVCLRLYKYNLVLSCLKLCHYNLFTVTVGIKYKRLSGLNL